MANPKHLEILKKGVKVWNEWRGENPDIWPDLSGADLSSADLMRANLRRSDLIGANLSKANLTESNLSDADLRDADLRDADLFGADLSSADLFGANLNEAIIWWVKFHTTLLEDTNFEKSQFGYTTVSDCDLSTTLKLNSVNHRWPSTIGIDTILKSKGEIPVSFLKGSGVPDNVIKTILPLAKERRFHTCFISYSSKDEPFTEKLKKNLEKKKIRCWFFPDDAIWGKDVYDNIDIAITIYDKLVVICSKNSLNSEPVLREMERGLQKEKKQKKMGRKTKRVLFPITIDDYLFKRWDHYLRPDLLRITVGDFKKWKDPDKYKEAFNKLLNGLQK